MVEVSTYRDGTSGRTYPDPTSMVNDYLRRFGEVVGVDLPPLDADGYTEVRRGSATVGINALAERGVLLLLSRMGPIPEHDRESFYRQLLELNFVATGDACFAVDDQKNAVYVRAMRRLGSLDYEEFEDLLHTVATLADEWDDHLGKESS